MFVSVSVKIIRLAKTAEQKQMLPHGVWTCEGPKSHVFDVDQISPHEGALWGGMYATPKRSKSKDGLVYLSIYFFRHSAVCLQCSRLASVILNSHEQKKICTPSDVACSQALLVVLFFF